MTGVHALTGISSQPTVQARAGEVRRSPERERIRLHARIEKLNFKQTIGDGLILSD
jgi:hypothetical protein